MKKYILMLVSSMMLVSCVDTVILPDHLTVDEDFWKEKEQVNSMVNAAYYAMSEAGVIQRLLVWGDYRTDEMVVTTATNMQTDGTVMDLKEISSVNIETDNAFAEWASLYTVINRCNIVLDKAGAVIGTDPSYTQGDYDAHCAQMRALRSLCYFYLVRNFRDVPYVTSSYMTSSQDMQVAQSAPQVVIDGCIADLESALTGAPSARAYSLTDWKRVGWINVDAVRAILADVYLWRASVTGSQSDYQRCISLCDEVIASKRDIYNSNHRGASLTETEYPLAEIDDMYFDVFINHNAEETIFESQILVGTYYNFFRESGGYVRAGDIFTGNQVYLTNNDVRYASFIYDPTSTPPVIRKMISNDSKSTNTWDTYIGSNKLQSNHFIFYRLSDVMLMKAEALVQTVQDDMSADSTSKIFQQAFNLVAAVNTRGLAASNKADALKWATYSNKTKEEMEEFVMDERLRELCFEGKRYYDLLRYNYRHIVGVDYSRTLSQIGVDNLPALYDKMLTTMTRSRTDEAAGVKGKMSNEAYLYLPIPKSELIVGKQLVQNPVYSGSSNSYERTY